MRVHLELHRDEWKFATLRSSLGEYRSLLVEINGRPFSTWSRVEDWREYDEGYMKAIDDQLAREFEYMIERLLKVAVAMVPVGVDLLRASAEEISEALKQAEYSQPKPDRQ